MKKEMRTVVYDEEMRMCSTSFIRDSGHLRFVLSPGILL
jgi:hypothetical protein